VEVEVGLEGAKAHHRSPVVLAGMLTSQRTGLVNTVHMPM